MPHRINVLEALGIIGDVRIEINCDRAKVNSSTRDI